MTSPSPDPSPLSPDLSSDHWDLYIKPHTRLFDLHLADVWRYRDLLWLFVRRDFVAVYKQTILGPLWFFIQPLFTTIVFTLTPIIYPLSAIPEKWRWLVELNPMTAPIEAFRALFLGGPIPWSALATSTAITAALLAIGVVIFNRVEKTFMDTV